MELIGDSANLAVFGILHVFPLKKFWNNNFLHQNNWRLFHLSIYQWILIVSSWICRLVGGFSTKNLHKNYLFFGRTNRLQNRLAFQIARRSLAAEAASSKFSLASCASTAVPGVEQKSARPPGWSLWRFVFFFKGKVGCFLKSLTVINPHEIMELKTTQHKMSKGFTCFTNAHKSASLLVLNPSILRKSMHLITQEL